MRSRRPLGRQQKADPPHLLRPLRSRRHRPSDRRAAERG
jgi:hypothetical protein